MNSNNIILIGFMGSGKTSFGKWISKNKAMTFLDTDECIVKRQKRSINEIFAKEGEEYFRDLETNLIKEMVSNIDNTVISVGGGLAVREENRVMLKQLGTVVYLRTGIDELVKRLSADTTRPLLKGGDLRNKIESLMDKREALYLDAADVIVDTDNRQFKDMYESIFG